MTENEAIKMLKSKMDGHTDTSYEWAETVRMAIKALERASCIKEKCAYCPHCEHCDVDDETLAIKALEPSEDAISRQATIDAIYKKYIGGKDAIKNASNDYADGLAEAVDAVWDMPSVTPTRPKGKWIDIQYFEADDTYYRPKCPFCSIEPKEYSNCCPNCGAKMQEVEE